jgi:hypothetical protein
LNNREKKYLKILDRDFESCGTLEKDHGIPRTAERVWYRKISEQTMNKISPNFTRRKT